MAAFACGTHSISGNNASKPPKDHLRRSKDSRRRQAALLFLNNISLDGRPVYRLSNGNSSQRDPEVQGLDAATTVAGVPLSTTTSSSGAFALQSPAPASGSAATPGPRFAIANQSPGLVFPVTGAGHTIGANEVFLEGGRIAPLPSQSTHFFPTGTQLNPISLANKSTTLLSVQSCNALNLDSRQRLRNPSGSSLSSRQPAKKVHFIKNMRQYDTRGSRIVLICARRSLCTALSVLPYGQSVHVSDPKVEAQRKRHSSGGGASSLDTVPGLEGVELGALGKTVSYARFLLPTNALVRQKTAPIEAPLAQVPPSRNSVQRNYTPSRLNSTIGQEPAGDDLSEYDPNLLSDPQWPCGKHKRVLIFASYMTTVIEYVKPSDLKKDMNEMFKEKFPHIKLTLSKIRSLKREMRAVGEESGLQPVAVAMAFVYFEKLVLQGRLNKQNRKLVSAVCVLLAAKISSDLKKQEVKLLIDKLEERFRINHRELIPFEFTVLVALEMALYLPESKVMPHYRRLAQQP